MVKKNLLIIDDSEIDRSILENILGSDFKIFNADNGYSGLQILMDKKARIDAVLLDLSMPILDGFDVLEHMQMNGINDMPVILITAEATESNVHKAASYNVAGFILKPFEPEVILSRVKGVLGVGEASGDDETYDGSVLRKSDMEEVSQYISKLENIYRTYLKNNNKNDNAERRVSDVMEILLSEYVSENEASELSSAEISVISKAAYFYDIGMMMIPDSLIDSAAYDETDKKTYQSHTIVGADIIWLNQSPACGYFIKICGDMCMHHHERIDGKGYPHGIQGSEITLYTQLCSAAIKFDRIFSKFPAAEDTQFDFAVNEISVDKGEFSEEAVSLLKSSRDPIRTYYKKALKERL